MTAELTMAYPGPMAEEDQQTMQAFIRSQMYSIMHPVAEHVREVQAQVQQLAKRVTASDGKIEEHRVCMENQHDECLNLRRSLSQHDASLEKLHDGLDLAHREKDKLGTDHETTKSDLSKVAADLRTTNSLLKAMQQKVEDHDADVVSLHTGVEKMGRTFALEAEKGAQTAEFANGLNVRQMEMMQRLDELARSAVETNRGLHKLTQHCEKVHGTTNAELARQQEHIDSIEGRLAPTMQDVQVNKEAIRAIEEKIRLLRASLHIDGEGSDGSMDASRSESGSMDVIPKLQSDIEGLKGTLNNLQELFNSYKEDHVQVHKDLDRRIGDNNARLEGLLQAAKESLSEHLRRHDNLLSKVQHSLDVVGGQVDMLQQDTKSMQSAHGDLASKVDGQRILLTKTQADLKQTGGLVDAANESLLHLKGGLAAMDVTVSKLGSRYDSCTRNVHGVGRGLQDVGRHVAHGDHGMLPPKSPLTRRLPNLNLSSTGGSLDGSMQSAR